MSILLGGGVANKFDDMTNGVSESIHTPSNPSSLSIVIVDVTWFFIASRMTKYVPEEDVLREENVC